MLPLVSFIIPYFNAGSTIEATIASVFKQSYQNFEIWLINDGSTDSNSIQKLSQFEKEDNIKILHQENSGPSVARNVAIKQCNGEIIVPLDADDIIENDTIDIAVRELVKNPKIGAVYGDINFIGKKEGVRKQVWRNFSNQLLYNQIAVTALIRKRVFEDVGYYDETLSKLGLEDWEFWIRVGKSDWKLKKVDVPFLKVRVSSDSRTHSEANKNLDTIKKYVVEKHAKLYYNEYEKLFYEKKQLLESPDYRIGNIILKPYRLLKSLFM